MKIIKVEPPMNQKYTVEMTYEDLTIIKAVTEKHFSYIRSLGGGDGPAERILKEIKKITEVHI